MSYIFYSFRNRTEQDEGLWANQTYEGLIASSRNRKLHQIFDKYLNKPKMKILEAGCGMGTWIHNLRAKGHDVIGIDYMESTVQKAKQHDPSLPIQHGDVNNLVFSDDSFDAYVSLGVIEHFREGPQQALAEAHRVLKADGLAFITVPYLNLFRRLITHPMRNIYFTLRRLQGKKDYFWEYRYTKNELRSFLEGAGFDILHIDIDDYIEEDTKHHIGLCADFFFLRSKKGELWELNGPGKLLLKIGKLFSPWLFCSGLHFVAKKIERI